MKMTRRSFMGSILALGIAPAIVRADSLMQIVPRAMLLERRRGVISYCDELKEIMTGNQYRYTASFDLADIKDGLVGVSRIWADGREIPLYRFQFVRDEISGLTVARAKDLDLTDFGNRIPNVEFELPAH